MSKKLVHINVTSNWGSTGKICEGICNLAQQNGWCTYIAYGRYLIPGDTKTVKIGTAIDSYIHLIGTRLLDRQGLFSKSATKKFIEELEKIHPDIIHLHNIHGYYLNYPLIFDYIKKSNIPVVWTLHDCWPFTGHCVYFDEIDCGRWIKGCYKCPQPSSYPKSLFLDRSKKNWAEKKSIFSSYSNITFVPVSHWIDGFLKQSFFRNYLSHVIHNGIDIDIFHPITNAGDIVRRKYGINQCQHIILGVASRWDKRKGLDDFIQISGMLGDTKYRFIIVGVDDKQLKRLPAHIIGIKRTNNQEELAILYSAADVYINPTYSDTYPTTNLESIACGTPVITYNTGGSPESVTGNTGMVVARGDMETFAQTIVNFCETENIGTISQKCRNYALEHFDRSKCFTKYLEIYDKLIVDC